MPSRKIILRTGDRSPGRSPSPSPSRQTSGPASGRSEEAIPSTIPEGPSHPEGEVRKIQPCDSVYSFLMFTLPLEIHRNKGKLTWRCFVAIFLVVVTLMIKGVLLFAIFKAVVMEDIEWQNSILRTSQGHTPMAFLGGAPQETCRTDASLCAVVNGTYTCAPPTVQLMGRWDELDVNGDGVWTHEEALAKREALKCKYVVDPVEVFDIFVKFVLAREQFIWIHPDLRAGRSIHKAYFTYASGDLIMCGYRTEKMCANLLQRGVFDAPLREGTVPRVGSTIDSALNYCYQLLEKGGTCERNLPSTYAVWKTYTERQCWGARYDKYVYKHPTNGHQKSMLTVNYKAPKAYARASNSGLFRVYKGIIIGLFLLAMYAELKDILVNWIFVLRYPAAEDYGGEEVIEIGGDPPTVRIQTISKRHRFCVGFITVSRFLMVCMLIWVGVSFLMKDTDWVNLLLNGVALVFIMEVANRLFTEVLDVHLQEEFLSTEPMFVEMGGNKWLNQHPSLRDLLGFTALCLLMFTIMHVHLIYVDMPLSEAVECACLSSGPNCREASSFDHSFWQTYWTQDIPSAFGTVEQLKAASKHNRPISEIKAGASQVETRWADKQSPAQSPHRAPAVAPSPPPRSPLKQDTKAKQGPATKDGVRWHVVAVRGKQPSIKQHIAEPEVKNALADKKHWKMLNPKVAAAMLKINETIRMKTAPVA